jgi:ribosome-binding factor A
VKLPRRRRSYEFVDPDFAQALERDAAADRSHRRQAQHKAQQLCRQVQRALNLALVGSADECLSGVFVDEVTPAPACGRLLVRVVVPEQRRLAEALGCLHREAPRLRADVARAITRKRAPELSFIPAAACGGADE